MNSIELIDSLINQARALYTDKHYPPQADVNALENFRSRAVMILSNLPDAGKTYIPRLTDILNPVISTVKSIMNSRPFPYKNLEEIGIYNNLSPEKKRLWDEKYKKDREEETRTIFDKGVTESINLLKVLEEEVVLFQSDKKIKNTKAGNVSHLSSSTKNTTKIFIVHGHNDTMKLHVARSVEKLGLNAIILHEQPNLGKTIIEKFQEYSNVGYAIVLLSADDFVYSKNKSGSDAKFRARQNVILELGYFLGKLGRQRVMALYLPEENFEMPSDFSGVLYVAFDDAGKWQFDLVRELKACGYNVDANKLV